LRDHSNRGIERAICELYKSFDHLTESERGTDKSAVFVPCRSRFGLVFDAVVDEHAVAEADSLHTVGNRDSAVRSEIFISELQNGRMDMDTIGNNLGGYAFSLKDSQQRARHAMVDRRHRIEQMRYMRDAGVESIESLLVSWRRIHREFARKLH